MGVGLQCAEATGPRSARSERSSPMLPSLAIVPQHAETREATGPWPRIYVGLLTQRTPHPNADRDVVVEVEVDWTRLTVVTGGPHVEVGRKVTVARPGARVVDADSAVPRTRKLQKGRI